MAEGLACTGVVYGRRSAHAGDAMTDLDIWWGEWWCEQSQELAQEVQSRNWMSSVLHLIQKTVVRADGRFRCAPNTARTSCTHSHAHAHAHARTSARPPSHTNEQSGIVHANLRGYTRVANVRCLLRTCGFAHVCVCVCAPVSLCLSVPHIFPPSAPGLFEYHL